MSEHNIAAQGGGWYWTVSMICMAIPFANVETFLKVVAVIGGIGSSIMAMRYYYYATKKAKQ